ncbi:MAG: class I SAM-dependent methyltransferase [Victivallaceae bacterium]|nr:class I SAM-dependent methyltransferase [Victivallaceae bacterium]
MNCTLCGSEVEKLTVFRGNQYFSCGECHSIILNPKSYVSAIEEKKRYEEHNNDVEDKRYQKFVSPIVEKVLADYKEDHKGLDFGAGTGPVITKLLKEKGYNVAIYDPFFANYPERLKEQYDYVMSCEVIEHFHNPKKEFELLKSLLKSGGTLYIKTELYSDDIDFDSWYYKNDITHVFFYHRKTLEWIKRTYEFSNLEIKKDIIIFKTFFNPLIR